MSSDEGQPALAPAHRLRRRRDRRNGTLACSVKGCATGKGEPIYRRSAGGPTSVGSWAVGRLARCGRGHPFAMLRAGSGGAMRGGRGETPSAVDRGLDRVPISA